MSRYNVGDVLMIHCYHSYGSGLTYGDIVVICNNENGYYVKNFICFMYPYTYNVLVARG